MHYHNGYYLIDWECEENFFKRHCKNFKNKNFGMKASHDNSSTTSNSTSKGFQRNCHFCKKHRHKKSECKGFKEWLEKKDILIAFVRFKSNFINVLSNTW